MQTQEATTFHTAIEQTWPSSSGTSTHGQDNPLRRLGARLLNNIRDIGGCVASSRENFDPTMQLHQMSHNRSSTSSRPSTSARQHHTTSAQGSCALNYLPYYYYMRSCL